MSYSIENKSEETMDYAQELLDENLLQTLQDRFCAATNLYCVCLNRTHGVVTRAYGSREELNYVHDKIGMSRHVLLLDKLLAEENEDVVEEKIEEKHLKMCGVGIRVGGKLAAIWIVIGVIKEDGILGDDVPSCVKTTTTEQFYRSIEFLEMQTRQYFAVKLDELLAQEAFLKSRENQKKLEAELKRNETITAVLQNLESEKCFTEIVEDILKEVCTYLKIESGRMLWADESREFFESHASSDILAIPVEINGRTELHLVFSRREKDSVFSEPEIRFLNEIKQIVQSIRSKQIAKESFATSYASLEAILENVGCAICVRDPLTGGILYTNRNLKEFFSNKSIEQAAKVISSASDCDKNSGFCEYHDKEQKRWFDICHTNIRWVDGRDVVLSTVYEVTEKKLYQQKIEKQANNDFLTGLYNRMRCEQDIMRYVKEAKETGGQGALLYIDLDDFKHINDGLGHQYGDVLLQAISHSLQRVEGIENTCYRMGGDEFIIIVRHQVFHMLNNIIDEIGMIFSKPWFLKGADYYCTMSMGIVKFPEDVDTVSDLIKKADMALYEAKKGGKNRVRFYDDNVEEITSFKRLDLEKNMRYATLNACEEFEVYYQPVIDISREGSPCVGAEALVRWNSQAMGFIHPTEFIPLAEYLGLINPIGEFVLREACKRLRYWNESGHPEYRVNINLSVVQLLQNDMVDRIRAVIEETGVNPFNLTLEVTESLAINDMGRMKKVLAEIKRLGVWVALDDFGTGYSSLNHVREMPIDIIKIDRCFIIDIGKDDYSEVFVKMVAELAETIGVHMCVEGVEEETQLQKLRDMKIQYIQGYYFGKPMPAKEFEEKYLF